MPPAFRHPTLSLFEAVDALKAYDSGATDSGIHDEDLRESVRAHLCSLGVDERRRMLARLARLYLTDTGIARGYGLEDVVALAEWLDRLGVPTP